MIRKCQEQYFSVNGVKIPYYTIVDCDLPIDKIDFDNVPKYVFVNHLVYALGYRNKKDQSSEINHCEYYLLLKK